MICNQSHRIWSFTFISVSFHSEQFLSPNMTPNFANLIFHHQQLISLTSNTSNLKTTPHQPPPPPTTPLSHCCPAIIPDVLPVAMETQHSRVRRQTHSLHIQCFWTAVLQSWCFPLQFREHLPRGRTPSGSAPGPQVHRTQKSVRSLVSLYNSIKLGFIFDSFKIIYVFIWFPQKCRRWGALHVRIAWKIYHHKQLKVS